MVLLLFAIVYVFSTVECANNKTIAKFNAKDFSLEQGQIENNSISLESPFIYTLNSSFIVNLYFTYQQNGDSKIFKNESFLEKVFVAPLSDIQVFGNSTGPFSFNITARAVGSVYLGINSSDIRFKNVKSTYCKVNVVYSHKLEVLGSIIGWIYFVAWTVSFYPQVCLNCYKKSVIGLNFDFILFNWLGFFSYSAFNVGLYWIESIKEMFQDLNPRSVNPVQLNDVIFSLHALAIVSFQVIQCSLFERGKQRLSKFGLSLFGAMIVYIVIILSLAASKIHSINWLTFLYFLSYLKLFITIIKYIPQAYMNYKRKSTVGWSIGNVLLDFIGGLLSIVQMIVLAYNNDDWKGFFSDPTKFGLGLFSILFDVIFIVQHYILYRNPKEESYEVIQDENSSTALF